MASSRQIEANRRNAKRSTGPKSAGGKTRSSRNALRHGLARSDISDPAEAENLAVAIAAGLGHPVSPDAAMALARSKLALLRIRSLRHDLLATLLNWPVPARLNNLERYERAALAKHKRALRALGPSEGEGTRANWLRSGISGRTGIHPGQSRYSPDLSNCQRLQEFAREGEPLVQIVIRHAGIEALNASESPFASSN